MGNSEAAFQISTESQIIIIIASISLVLPIG